jgi:hypothetical protein
MRACFSEEKCNAYSVRENVGSVKRKNNNAYFVTLYMHFCIHSYLRYVCLRVYTDFSSLYVINLYFSVQCHNIVVFTMLLTSPGAIMCPTMF